MTTTELLPTPPEASEWRSTGDLDQDLAELRALVEGLRIDEARAIAPRLLERWPQTGAAQHWARVLEPPKARVGDQRETRSFDREFQWLCQHRHEYPGRWIAVYQDRLIIADPDPGRVCEAVRQAIGDQSATIYFQPPYSK